MSAHVLISGTLFRAPEPRFQFNCRDVSRRFPVQEKPQCVFMKKDRLPSQRQTSLNKSKVPFFLTKIAPTINEKRRRV